MVVERLGDEVACGDEPHTALGREVHGRLGAQSAMPMVGALQSLRVEWVEFVDGR
ncbi:hypothetical protein GCM10023319_74640 [Nocardia iowensis]